jgi:probable rRNA maturation factor
MKIAIENRQNQQKIEKVPLRRVAKKILSVLGCHNAHVSVLIVDDAVIQEINLEYLGKDRPTNVMSFAMQEGEGEGIQPDLLGDVVISAETAARDARDAHTSFESELYFLLLHGILHLLGYDHERGTQIDAERMEAKEREIFSLIREEFLPG